MKNEESPRLLLLGVVTRAAKLLFLQLQILPPRLVAHFALIHGFGRLAGQVRVHPIVGMDDHVRPVVAEVEAGGRADARDRLPSQRAVQILQLRANDFAAPLATIGVVAAGTGADKEKLLPWVSHELLTRSDKFFPGIQ